MQEIRCPYCGGNKTESLQNGNNRCLFCGKEFQTMNNPYYAPSNNQNDIFANGPSGKSRGVAGLLAIFLGCLGVQYFYLGKNTAGIICLLITFLSCGTLGTILGILTLIQGIMMLTMTESQFEEKYVYTPSTFPLF